MFDILEKERESKQNGCKYQGNNDKPYFEAIFFYSYLPGYGSRIIFFYKRQHATRGYLRYRGSIMPSLNLACKDATSFSMLTDNICKRFVNRIPRI